jgi:hypothetical protein
MGKRATKEFNLALSFPSLVSEWHPTKNKLNPEDYLPSSHFKVWWQCTEDKSHEWYASPDQMLASNRNGYCPHCRKEKPSK